jgi:hypothetical protein
MMISTIPKTTIPSRIFDFQWTSTENAASSIAYLDSPEKLDYKSKIVFVYVNYFLIY